MTCCLRCLRARFSHHQMPKEWAELEMRSLSPSPSRSSTQIFAHSVPTVLSVRSISKGWKVQGTCVRSCGALPPAVADDHIVASVAVEVADADPVIELVRAVVQALLLGFTFVAEGVERPLVVDLVARRDRQISD